MHGEIGLPHTDTDHRHQPGPADLRPFKYVDPDGRDAADRFSDQFQREAAAHNTKVYAPLVVPSAIVAGGMLVGPIIAAAIPETAASVTVTVPEVSGTYRIIFQSGREYIGKGLMKRMQRCIARLEKKYGDTAEKTEYKPASSHREAFKEESRQIDAAGGAQK